MQRRRGFTDQRGVIRTGRAIDYFIAARGTHHTTRARRRHEGREREADAYRAKSRRPPPAVLCCTGNKPLLHGLDSDCNLRRRLPWPGCLFCAWRPTCWLPAVAASTSTACRRRAASTGHRWSDTSTLFRGWRHTAGTACMGIDARSPATAATCVLAACRLYLRSAPEHHWRRATSSFGARQKQRETARSCYPPSWTNNGGQMEGRADGGSSCGRLV